jgi:hypothetical protein
VLGAIASNSVQDSHMRLIRGGLAASCLLAGLWLMLQELGLLGVVLHGLSAWWPAFPLALGVALLARSAKLGPHTVVSAGLIFTGCTGFILLHLAITERALVFIAAGGLMATGVLLIWLNARTPRAKTAETTRLLVLFRAASFSPQTTVTGHIKILLFCGHLDLDLTNAVHPGQDLDPTMIDITAWAGSVTIFVQSGLNLINHKAFVMRFRHPIETGVLTEEQVDMADLIAASIAFFGNVLIKEMEVSPSPDSTAPGVL